MAAYRLVSRAIELDPQYTKAYYRRGMCLMELKRFDEAAADFERVLETFPGDAEARHHLDECRSGTGEAGSKRSHFDSQFQKMFKSAIHVNRFALQPALINPLPVPEGWTGPRLEMEQEITVAWVMELIAVFKADIRLPIKYVYMLLMRAKELFAREPNVVSVDPQGGDFTICGDVHGQFFDMLVIFEDNGYPSATHGYLFNGDVVDRGAYSLECLLTLCAFKCALPDRLFVTRGNHESAPINRVHGFFGECARKYETRSLELYDAANDMMNALPLAHIVDGCNFVVHGGLAERADVTCEELQALDRFRVPPEGSLQAHLLWSDPRAENGCGPNERGEGVVFGPDVTARFLDRAGLKRLIRSHQFVERGYEVQHRGRCITIFSAPNYIGTDTYAAFIRILPGGQLSYRVFGAASYQGRDYVPRKPPVTAAGPWY